MNTPITIASCLVKSEPHLSDPNGDLTAAGTVSYFNNTQQYNEHIPTRISNVSVTNKNDVVFFGSERAEYSASALRAIARSIIELAARAEAAHAKLIELNQTK
jgi:hypothetical protein